METENKIRSLLQEELERDGWENDRTSFALFNEVHAGKAVVRTREKGVFCGELICKALKELTELHIEPCKDDGGAMAQNDVVVRVHGPVRKILSSERTLLNMMSHLCAIATETRKYVDATGGKSRILATRKTLPGMRDIQIMAVKAGGGDIRRTRLDEGILIKDNHLVLTTEEKALEKAKAAEQPIHGVELEVETLEALETALQNPPNVIMLDNMGVAKLRSAIEMIRKVSSDIEIELSGGISLEQVPILSKLGADSISVGRITHSVVGLDLTMEMIR